MAIDLGETGGQRQSRSSRSAGASVRQSGQSVRRTDTVREVAESPGFAQADAMASVANSLSSFFPALQQFSDTDHAEEMDRIALENSQEILRQQKLVRENPEKVTEARRTGDYSFFEQGAVSKRRVVANMFKSNVARQMAAQDYDEGLQHIIDDTPVDGDPDQRVAEFIKAQTKDSDPIFSQVYGQTIAKMSADRIQAFKQDRLASQQAKAIATAKVTIENAIREGDISTDLTGLDSLRATVRGSIPVNTVKADELQNTLVDSVIIDMIGKGGPAALKARQLAALKDPKRNGQSIEQLNPGKIEAALNKHRKRAAQAKSVEAINEFNAIRAGLIAQSKGLSTGPSMVDLTRRVMQYGNTHGWQNADAVSLLSMLPSPSKTAARTEGALDYLARTGQAATNMKKSEANKAAFSLFNGEHTKRYMDKHGAKTEAEAVQAQLDHAIVLGGSPDIRDSIRRQLFNSTDPEQAVKAYQKGKIILARAKGQELSGFMDDDTRAMIMAMDDAEKRGTDPATFLRTLVEKTEGDMTSIGDHYYKRVAMRGDASDVAAAKRHTTNELKKAWNDVEMPEFEVSSTAFGTIATKPNFEKMPPQVQDLMHRAMNQASLMLAGEPNVTDEKIATLAVRIASSNLSPMRAADGTASIGLNRLPRMVKTEKNGQIVGATVTPATFERIDRDMEKPANAAVLRAFGANTSPGVYQDHLTEQGNGLALTYLDEAGNDSPMSFMSGKSIIIPNNKVDEWTGKFFRVERLANGMSRLSAPDTPKPGEKDRYYVGDNTFMQYNPRNGTWSMRYGNLPEKTYMTMQELSAANRAKRKSRIEFDRNKAVMDRSRSGVTMRRAVRESLKAREKRGAQSMMGLGKAE